VAIERLSIALPTPMADQIREAVEAGEYASTSEVIRDALRLWDTRRALRERDVDALRKAWSAGKASGTAGPLNMREVIREERKKLGKKARAR
jgi:antitoxin ParD1/3/4